MNWTYTLLALSIIALLGGCRAPELASPTPTVVASPSPTKTSPPPSDFTPTPSTEVSASPTKTTPLPATPIQQSTIEPVVPTSTPTPSSLDKAKKQLQNGNLQAAAELLQTFLTSNADPEQASVARLMLAKTLFAQGKTKEAAALFEEITKQDATRDRFPEAFYWLGKATLPDDPERAARAFEAYAEISAQLAADGWIAAGDAWLTASRPMRAQVAYQQALQHATDTATALHAREGLAESALAAGDADEALAQYQAILKTAKSPSYRAEIWYRLGEVQKNAGQEEAAWRSFHQATLADKNSRYAYLALIELVNAEQAVDPLLRAEIDIAAGAFLPAISVLSIHLQQTPEDRTDQAYTLLAQAYEAASNYAQAAEAWRNVLTTTSNPSVKNLAWLGLGRSLWRQGLREDAREVYLAAAENTTDPEIAATALWWAAVLAGQDQDKWLQAAEDFARLAQLFPQSDYAAQAGFRAGLIHYRLNHEAEARSLWQEHAMAGRTMWHAAADFWLGKLLRATGEEEQALTHWRETAQRWGLNNFYGIRAQQKIQDHVQPPTTVTPPPEPPLQDVIAWIATFSPDTSPSSFEQSPSAFQRIEAWHRIGEDARGHWELERLRLTWLDDPVRLWQLALFARDLGYYDTSIRAAERLVTISGQSIVNVPRALQELVYPLYYRDLILQAAEDFHLDPALFFALIRQESLFWAPAASIVGAQGLAQIMPATGRSAANQLGMKDFSINDLKRPMISLHLGAYILSEELTRSNGNTFKALAAYNAGPGNAAFWWDLSNGDEDLFVELISFRETQKYVRTITVQAEHYRRLYPFLNQP